MAGKISMIKESVKKICTFFNLDLTPNMRYDRLTKKILKKSLKRDSNCIDIGCHKGEIVDLFLKFSPNGKHYGFEPLPDYFKKLKINYKTKPVTFFDIALSSKKGKSQFHFVKNAPSFSGLQKRKYDTKSPEIEIIDVEMDVLDNLIPAEESIKLIKIDVEGGELDVLKGAVETIKTNKPLIIFECGLGGSDFYGTVPEEVYGFFENLNFEIHLLETWLSGGMKISKEEFKFNFEKGKEYYFIASPKSLPGK